MTSQSPSAIFTKLLEFNRIVPPIKKTETAKIPTKSGGEFSYDYCGLDTIQKVINPLLNGVGLGYIQSIDERGFLKTTLFDAEGNAIASENYPLQLSGDAQSIGSALTYAKRYQLVAFLGLIIEDEDDDGQKGKNSKGGIEVFLDGKQYQALKLDSSQEIQRILKLKITKDGKSFGMKKEFRDGLEAVLASRENPPDDPNEFCAD